MIPEAVHSLIRHADAPPPPVEDATAFFWVDWREDDDQIPGLCEAVLRTGSLSADWDDDVLVIVWRGGRLPVPLTKSVLKSIADSHVVAALAAVLPFPLLDVLSWPSRGDRYVTLLALDRALHPDFEIRLVRGAEDDEPAFVPLARGEWDALEKQYGRAAVDAVFAPLREHPNPFTEGFP